MPKIEARVKGIDNVLSRLDNAKVVKGLQRGLKEIAKQTYTAINRETRQIYNIKAKDLKKHSSMKFTFSKDGTAKLVYEAKKISLVYFISPAVLKKIKQHYYVRRKGAKRLMPYVKVKVKRAGGYKLLAGGVFANMLTGLLTAKSPESHYASIQVIERAKGKNGKRVGRLPLAHKLVGLSAAQMVKNEIVMHKFQKFVETKGAKIILHEVDFATNKIKRKSA